MAEGRLRLTIVGGFLGAGKTTWLRHQLHEGRFQGAHLIVNEAAGVPVDDSLLGQAAALMVLSGGCACCEGQAGFRDALLAICDRRTRAGGAGLDQVVLETSGLADPAAIVAAIQGHPVLIRHIVIDRVIVVVDGVYGLAALTSEALARQQIAAADALVLSKLDQVGPDDLGRLRQVLRHLAPGAAQSGAAFGSPVELADLAVGEMALPDFGEGAPIVACQLDLGDAPDWTALTLWLSALLHAHGERIVRVKGVVMSPAGALLIQAVRGHVQAPETLPVDRVASGVENHLVLIGSGLDPAALAASLAAVRGLG